MTNKGTKVGNKDQSFRQLSRAEEPSKHFTHLRVWFSNLPVTLFWLVEDFTWQAEAYLVLSLQLPAPVLPHTFK